MSLIAADTTYLVVGLGLTGMSCVRYLVSQQKDVRVIDSRMNPPNLEQLNQEFPSIAVHTGSFNQDWFNDADVLVMSPGVSLKTPEVAQAIEQGKSVTSDIELFLNQYRGKVVAITGSNGKSTVTAWLGEVLKQAGTNALVAGNIGEPVLNHAGKSFDVAVLELSSFQLETIQKLNADIATVLNLSEDHMDRYDSMAEYQQAKQRIYFGVKTAISNRDDLLTQPLVPDTTLKVTFGSNEPDLKDYGVLQHEGKEYLSKGFEPVIAVEEVSLPGKHNVLNASAVLALADALAIPRDSTIKALKSFSGLPHRCQLVGKKFGYQFFNDSKATNVGSTQAAVNGLAKAGKKNLLLLLGGQGKGQDFQPLKDIVNSNCADVFCYGEDGQLIQRALGQGRYFETLVEALNFIKAHEYNADTVLLSPACASFDQFKNFEERGAAFIQWVEAQS